YPQLVRGRSNQTLYHLRATPMPNRAAAEFLKPTDVMPETRIAHWFSWRVHLRESCSSTVRGSSGAMVASIVINEPESCFGCSHSISGSHFLARIEQYVSRLSD